MHARCDAVGRIISAAKLSRVHDKTGLARQIEAEFKRTPALFDSLRPINKLHSHSIRVYGEDGPNVVIKYCGVAFAEGQEFREQEPPYNEGRKAWMHGGNCWRYYEFFEGFEHALRGGLIKPATYALVSLEVYGRVVVGIGNDASKVYLVMERVAEVQPVMCTVPVTPDEKSLSRSRAELVENVRALWEHPEDIVPMFRQLVNGRWGYPCILGNTAPADVENGVWVFAMPHDIQ